MAHAKDNEAMYVQNTCKLGIKLNLNLLVYETVDLPVKSTNPRLTQREYRRFLYQCR